VAGNLEVKEVVVDDGVMRDRFVICRNPDQAERDRAVRDNLLAQLNDAIAGSDKLSKTARAELAGGLPAGLRRFLRTTGAGRNLRHELDRMHLGTFTGPAGTVRRRTATTPAQASILRALDLAEPHEFSELRPACPAA
jgi:hypothetical protein